MTYARSTSTLRRALLPIGVGLVMVMSVLALHASRALAYEGIFCYGISLGPEASCTSSSVSHIRRAIGEAPESDTEVQISTNIGFKSGSCSSEGCTADTGYLSADGTGTGKIHNNTVNRRSFYYGYLYP